MDVTLLFLGLPLVLSSASRNLFVAAGQCLLIVIGFKLVEMACQGLGNTYYISPALAVWFPAMVFMPMAAFMYQAFHK